MYDAYKRVTSYFEKSPLAATGLPSDAEKALLEPFRDKLPARFSARLFRRQSPTVRARTARC